MLLNAADLDFIYFQLTLPGNDPRRAPLGTQLDPWGIRDVQGIGNNLLNPVWGAADQLFPRLVASSWSQAQGSYTVGPFGFVQNLTPISYATRALFDGVAGRWNPVNLIDATPRQISNLVANQSPEALSAIGYLTPGEQALAVLDDPSATPGGRLSPLTGTMNPLPYSSYLTMVGQFFDHGLDFVHKGVDGSVMVPLLPGDPLYVEGSHTNFMMASRTNTALVNIGVASTDALVTRLGLVETPLSGVGSPEPVTGAVVGATVGQAGVLMINNTAITVAANTTRQGLVDLINAQTSTTGVEASLSGSNELVLTPLAGESRNTVSPFIDLSQSYGSDPSHTAFVREYRVNGSATGAARYEVTGRLVSGDGSDVAHGMATWAGIKANAARIGITLHDKDVTDIPEVRLNADGSVYFDAGGAWLVARDLTTGAIHYVRDSHMGSNTVIIRVNADGTQTELTGVNATNARGNLLLQTVGHAFLDDMAHDVLDANYLDAAGDLNGVATPEAFAALRNSRGTLLSASMTYEQYLAQAQAKAGLLADHFIAGDGRANENIGLTAIHDVFHAEHNRVLEEILGLLTPVTGSTINIGTATTNSLSAALGLAEQNNTSQSLLGTTTITGAVPNGGAARTLVINNTNITIAAGSTLDDVVTAINAAQGSTGVAAVNNGGRLQLLASYYTDANGGVWTGERLFQAAKLVTEMEYQHMIFGEFARKLSPNINAFAQYDVLIDPAISAEFAHAVYRFGHSMLTETVGLQRFDANGVRIPDQVVDTNAAALATTLDSKTVTVTATAHGLVTGNYVTLAGVDNAIGGIAASALNGSFKVTVIDANRFTIQAETAETAATSATSGLVGDAIKVTLNDDLGLIEAFLNPRAYTDKTAGEVAIGMSQQAGNAIDEWVTDALRNNLVGLPLDLATLNIVRGRDTGVPGLNEVRRQLYAQTGATTLKPYDSWDEFAQNLLHEESLENFIMAYAADAIANFTGATLRDKAHAAINDTAFMLGNEGLESIDFWLGGLAEKKVVGGMLGSTFDFIFAMQMIHLQNSDRFYYLGRLAGTDLLLNIEAQLLSDIVMRNTGVKHLYSDIFSVADGYLELSETQREFGSVTALGANINRISVTDVLGNTRLISTAGWVGDTFYGNPGDYLDARGVFSPNGKGNASEMIGGTDNSEKINAGGGNDTVWADGGHDTVEGGAGNDFLHGGAGNDRITDSEGDDLIWGDDGDDYLHAGDGVDQVFGGEGADTVYGGSGADVIDGGAGNDLIYGDNGALVAGVMDSTGGDDIIDGGDGDDTIYGGGGNDAINGGEGDDLIYGGPGFDALAGWTGDDRFIMDRDDFGFGNLIDGGTGYDVVDYSASIGNGVGTGANRQGINIDLGNGGVGLGPAVALAAQVPDTFLAVEGVIGSAYNDTLSGSTNVDPLLGPLTGVQTDILGNPINFGTPLAPVYRAIDFYFDGGAGNDSIIGGQGHDTLIGGAGNDTLAGGLGNDIYFVDGPNDVIVELLGEGTDEVRTALGTYSLAARANVENLTYMGGATFSGTGNALANIITAGTGNDTLNGGAGNDTLIGGAGNDLYVVDAAGDVVVELADEGLDTVQASVSYTLGANVENLVLTGAATLNGTGNALANSITGNAAANILSGGAGNDTLSGGGGNDTLIGGLGVDVLTGGAGNDRFVFQSAADSGLDQATRDRITDFVRGQDLIDLSAIDANTNVVGSNTFDFIGTSAFTAAGQLRYTYDAGLNQTIVQGSTSTGTAAFSIALDGNLALTLADFIGAQAAPTPPAPVTGSTFNGNNNANTITGTAGNDVINGLGGNDNLNGGAGNDWIDGGAGNDILNGGLGNDTLVGGAGNDLFRFNTALGPNNVDVIQDFNAAQDRIQLENAVFTALRTTGTLNANFLRVGTQAQDNNDYIIYNPNTGALYYDADADGRGAMVQFATLTNPLGTLSNQNFQVI